MQILIWALIYIGCLFYDNCSFNLHTNKKKQPQYTTINQTKIIILFIHQLHESTITHEKRLQIREALILNYSSTLVKFHSIKCNKDNWKKWLDVVMRQYLKITTWHLPTHVYHWINISWASSPFSQFGLFWLTYFWWQGGQ